MRAPTLPTLHIPNLAAYPVVIVIAKSTYKPRQHRHRHMQRETGRLRDDRGEL